MIYALIADSVVTNIVVCDDDDTARNLFSEYTVVNVDALDVGIGWGYRDNKFIEPPAPETPPEDIYQGRLNTAQAEYDRATVEINKLNDQITDSDYAGTTEDAVNTELKGWTDYRKSLRAYLKNNDGSIEPPIAP